MLAYPRRVLLPGDPGDVPVRGRPVYFALLSLTVCLTGAAAASGAPLSWHSANVPTVASRPAPPLARNADHVRIGDVDKTGPRPVVRVPRPAAAPVRLPAKPVAPRPTGWVPRGTGMWIHEWPKTMRGNAQLVVRRARAFGITTLYLRTGTRKGGFDGAPQLRALLAATRGTQIQVVPWDFPTLENPRADALRLARAARYHAGGTGKPQIHAVAPDIETPSEGARSSSARVNLYLRTLRSLLPPGTSILSTVPWPSEQRRGRFPYAVVARHSDALMPMTYWYSRNPASVTAFSVRWLRQFHRPVLPVGQGYDSKVDASYLPHSNQPHEIGLFMRAARLSRVPGVSVWSWQTSGSAQWRALAAYRHAFSPPQARPHPRTGHQPVAGSQPPQPGFRQRHRKIPT